MFDIGWSEMMLIGIVALIVIGPKELPAVLRTVGRTVTKLRRMAGEFQGQFQDALREAELSGMRDEIGNITDTAKKAFPGTEAFDPLRSIREEIRNTVESAGKPAAAASAAAVSGAVTEADASVTPSSDVTTSEPASSDPVSLEAAPVNLAAAPTGAVVSEPLQLAPLPEPAAEPVFDFAPSTPAAESVAAAFVPAPAVPETHPAPDEASEAAPRPSQPSSTSGTSA